MEPLLDEVIPVDIVSQNTGRGNRWFNAAKIRNQFEDLLILQNRRKYPIEVPVDLEYTRRVGPGQRAWDQDNLALALKQFQDALVSMGWFHDDSPKWIRSIRYRHDTEHREAGAAIRVVAYPAD